VFQGISLFVTEFPLGFIEDHWLDRRLYERSSEQGTEREVRFLLRDHEPLLPVWYAGQFQLVRWGNRNRRNGLPMGGWTWLATVEAGGWGPFGAEPVTVPATFGLDGGVWFMVHEGIRAVLVRDENEEPVVFLICEPASRYYEVMTRGSKRMPVFVNQVI
jgi:hypothetical protein